MKPDLVTLAKGLANGLPIGALLVADEAAGAFAPGDHGSTFGGNPVSCAAACAVRRHDRRRAARAASARTARDCSRGRGAARASSRRAAPACSSAPSSTGRRSPVVDAALDAGLVCLTSGPNVLRLAPPLVVEPAHVDRALAHPRGGPRMNRSRTPRRDPAAHPRAADLDADRARRRAAERRARGRPDDRLARHPRARADQGAERRAAGSSTRFPEDATAFDQDVADALSRWALDGRAEREPRRRHDAVRLCAGARAGDRRRAPSATSRGRSRARTPSSSSRASRRPAPSSRTEMQAQQRGAA